MMVRAEKSMWALCRAWGAALLALIMWTVCLASACGVYTCAWADDAAANTASNTAARNVDATVVVTNNAASAAANTAIDTSTNTAANQSASNGSAGESAESNRTEITLDEDLNAIKEDQLPDSSFIYDTSVADLAKADTYYDQQTVQIVGEAVGDIINEGIDSDYCWVTLYDKGNTVTLYMKRADTELIDTLGSYSRKGTTLQVRGVYNLVCSEHDGASDLHVTNVTVTSKGSTVNQQANLVDFVPGIALIVAGLLLLLLFRHLRERQR